MTILRRCQSSPVLTQRTHCVSKHFIARDHSFRSKSTVSEHRNLLPSIAICFQASQSAFAAISIVSEQLRFRATQSLPSTTASAATPLPGESSMLPGVVSTLVPINGLTFSLFSEFFTILNDCRNTGLTIKIIASKRQQHWFRSMVQNSHLCLQKATTLVPINGHGSTLMPMVQINVVCMVY